MQSKQTNKILYLFFIVIFLSMPIVSEAQRSGPICPWHGLGCYNNDRINDYCELRCPDPSSCRDPNDPYFATCISFIAACINHCLDKFCSCQE